MDRNKYYTEYIKVKCNEYYYSLVWLLFRNKILNMHPQLVEYKKKV